MVDLNHVWLPELASAQQSFQCTSDHNLLKCTRVDQAPPRRTPRSRLMGSQRSAEAGMVDVGSLYFLLDMS
jgi:hypothetical protein